MNYKRSKKLFSVMCYLCLALVLVSTILEIRWLSAAGLGVAMENASEEVQSCADEVTQTNDEDGVAQMIERVLGL